MQVYIDDSNLPNVRRLNFLKLKNTLNESGKVTISTFYFDYYEQAGDCFGFDSTQVKWWLLVKCITDYIVIMTTYTCSWNVLYFIIVLAYIFALSFNLLTGYTLYGVAVRNHSKGSSCLNATHWVFPSVLAIFCVAFILGFVVFN